MKNIDPERVERLISSMRESVRLLHELKDLPETKFIKDIHLQSSAKYNFIVAIEAAIDIANHLISKGGFRAPEDYADTFRVLSDVNIFDEKFTEELEKMARFRNRLVHIYWDIDIKEIWKILQTRLVDFEKYLSQIGAYISSKT